MHSNDQPPIGKIVYRYYGKATPARNAESVVPIGIDTEAYITGQCFMIATSLGDVFTPEQFPACMFTRKYRGRTFVAYNLKYDVGALLQFLPMEQLKDLREHHRTEYQGFVVKIIPQKSLVIRKGKNAVTFYDMLNFFNMSLDDAAGRFLGEHKSDMETKSFYPFYAQLRWQRIASYCIQDAVLVQKLSQVIIQKFESYGVFPRKLYSVAYISFQYFRSMTEYPTVERLWKDHRGCLAAALAAYNGGKFEVTEKGCNHYYEYDIVSAYPREIADLVDIRYARIEYEPKYRCHDTYGFYLVEMKVPYECSSPVSLKRGSVNTYPCGELTRWITKKEYEYLRDNGVDLTIRAGYHLYCYKKVYPFRKEIEKLMKLKHQFKAEGADTDYHVIKIFLNSLYGKMVQLVKKGERWEAGMSWNPIYAAVITANVRIRVSQLQQTYPSIVAVHTDSVISTKPLPFPDHGDLGDLIFECEGDGVIIGSGVYQIGQKVKFRGFNMPVDLVDLLDTPRKHLKLSSVRPLTWREVAFHNWSVDTINKFEQIDRKLDVNFDSKRLWLNDWHTFRDVLKRKVISVPLIVDPVLYY